jgi:polyisoprenoid-binding protein YceI
MSFRLAIPALLALAGVAGAADYDVDPVHTEVMFKVNHFGVSNFLGRFDDTTGKISWDEADPSKSSVKYEIKAESIDTNFAKRDQHLKSPDFLDAKQFATLSFVSKSIKKVGDGYVVEGDLTIHGVTKPMQVAVQKTGEGKDPTGAERIGFWTTFSIKRSDFGMTNMVGPVGDAIDITIASEGVKMTDGGAKKAEDKTNKTESK